MKLLPIIILLSADIGGATAPSGAVANAPIENAQGIVPLSDENKEPENKLGVKQSKQPTKDIQEHAAEQAARNQRDIETGRPTPDIPATAGNLASYHKTRAEEEANGN